MINNKEDLKCLPCMSYVTKSDKSQVPCDKNICYLAYPFCKFHLKRRFSLDQFNQLENKNLICSEMLVTGKNKGKCCSKFAVRGNICNYHLQNYLTKCYSPNCDSLSFYSHGLCSTHCGISSSSNTREFICPCPKHDTIYDNFDQNFKQNKIKYFCLTHQTSDCNCLWEYVHKVKTTEVVLPDDIIEHIFSFCKPKNIYVLRCVNKYFKSYDYLTDINLRISNIFDNKISKVKEITTISTFVNIDEQNLIKLFPRLNKTFNNLSQFETGQLKILLKLIYKIISLEILSTHFEQHSYLEILISDNYNVFGINQDLLSYFNQINNHNLSLLHFVEFIYDKNRFNINLNKVGKINNLQKDKYLILICIFYKIIINNINTLISHEILNYSLLVKINKDLTQLNIDTNCLDYIEEYNYFRELGCYLEIEFSKRSNC